uniref:Deoxyribonuclease II n=1 Tax=Mesocestoides corti TaxID=53468 RepID=A0A5K3G1M9_MESCO
MKYLCFIFILLHQFSSILCHLGCRDDQNQHVNWFVRFFTLFILLLRYIGYKFPDGYSYAYITPNLPDWRLSSNDLRKDGFLKNTFDQIYNNTNDSLVFGVYNDEMPLNVTWLFDIWFGHMKGLFAFFENSQGFWLIHSVPKLSMKSDAFIYPETGKHYAQHFLCVSLGYSALATIADHLTISRPRIQAYKLPESVEKSLPALKDIFEHRYRRGINQTLITSLNSTDGSLDLRLFSKSHKFNHDLYTDLVAPNLESSLLTETWRHTRSNLPSNCTQNYSV